MKILHATNGPLAGSSFELGASTVIGRDGEVDIQVLDEGVSRRHACVVENEDGTFSILDLGSSNGTKVDGESVHAAKLKQRSRIEIGDTLFVFGEVAPEQVDVGVPDMKLTSGPALESTVMQEPDQVVAALRAMGDAAEHEDLCCPSPLAHQAREAGWPHCPGCGADLAD